MRTVTLKCGCRHELERERWLTLCPAHEAEFQATHQRWAAEHKSQTEVTHARSHH